jgi:hypothetical protein
MHDFSVYFLALVAQQGHRDPITAKYLLHEYSGHGFGLLIPDGECFHPFGKGVDTGENVYIAVT